MVSCYLAIYKRCVQDWTLFFQFSWYASQDGCLFICCNLKRYWSIRIMYIVLISYLISVIPSHEIKRMVIICQNCAKTFPASFFFWGYECQINIYHLIATYSNGYGSNQLACIWLITDHYLISRPRGLFHPMRDHDDLRGKKKKRKKTCASSLYFDHFYHLTKPQI